MCVAGQPKSRRPHKLRFSALPPAQPFANVTARFSDGPTNHLDYRKNPSHRPLILVLSDQSLPASNPHTSVQPSSSTHTKVAAADCPVAVSPRSVHSEPSPPPIYSQPTIRFSLGKQSTNQTSSTSQGIDARPLNLKSQPKRSISNRLGASSRALPFYTAIDPITPPATPVRRNNKRRSSNTSS